MPFRWFGALALLAACSDRSAANVEPDAPDPLAACASYKGDEPRTVEHVMKRVDELPTPSIECLVVSLPRPLSIVASLSATSLQPSVNDNSPRIFLMFDALTMSVVAEGDGANAVEFGEWVTPTRSLKGEIRFPVTRPLAADLPYHHLVDDGQVVSSCGFCHTNEQRSEVVEGAFVSDALQPGELNELSLTDVRAIRASCDSDEGPHCWLLHALFDHGEVREGAFAKDVRRGF